MTVDTPRRRRRWTGLGLCGLVACVMIALAIRWPPSDRGNGRQSVMNEPGHLKEPVVTAEAEQRIRAFCGDCHAVPRPASFHRDAWYDEVRKGYWFYAKSGRTDLDPPPIELTTAHFRERAPERLTYPQPEEAPTPFPATFRVEEVGLDPEIPVTPAISHLCWLPLTPGGHPELVASDMRTGRITAFDPRVRENSHRLLARLNHPCHLEPCDLDASGRPGFLVADLGSSAADDHDRGQVIWLRNPGTDTLESVVLAAGLGRVADVRAADLDRDGRLDLIVAEFGMHRTGKILLLRNVTERGERLHFETTELDPRPGTINVPIADFDHDGRPDFAALVSQEYECVDLFLNQGHGKFHRQTVWQAPDLTFGSNGLELVDLDGDGDRDFLYTNGDAFDNMYLSPWHGVQWLERLSDLRFQYHRLTDMPGACRAATGDFDGDGDRDIVVTAWLPSQFRPDTLSPATLPALVVLEQIAPGRFVRHTLKVGFPHYAALAVGDFDDDGALDFAVGVNAGDLSQPTHRLAIWWNQRRRSRD